MGFLNSVQVNSGFPPARERLIKTLKCYLSILCKGLSQVGDDVFGILDPAGQADHVVGDAEFGAVGLGVVPIELAIAFAYSTSISSSGIRECGKFDA
jgi:hypothetical protein